MALAAGFGGWHDPRHASFPNAFLACLAPKTCKGTLVSYCFLRRHARRAKLATRARGLEACAYTRSRRCQFLPAQCRPTKLRNGSRWRLAACRNLISTPGRGCNANGRCGLRTRRGRLAIDDAGRFLDQWGGLALEFQWTAADL